MHSVSISLDVRLTMAVACPHRPHRASQAHLEELDLSANVMGLWTLILQIIFVAHLLSCMWHYIGWQQCCGVDLQEAKNAAHMFETSWCVQNASASLESVRRICIAYERSVSQRDYQPCFGRGNLPGPLAPPPRPFRCRHQVEQGFLRHTAVPGGVCVGAVHRVCVLDDRDDDVGRLRRHQCGKPQRMVDGPWHSSSAIGTCASLGRRRSLASGL